MRFGAIVLDDPNNPGGDGWASVEGEAGWRLSGVGDISKTDVIWLTNMSWSAHRAWGRDEYLMQDYLPVGMDQMAREWGYDPKLLDPAELVALVSALMGRIMRVAAGLLWPLRNVVDPRPQREQGQQDATVEDLFRWMISPLKEGRQFIRGPGLKNLFESVFPPGEFPPLGMEGATASAIQNWTRTSLTAPKGTSFVMLRRPRLMHTLDLLQTPEPRGPWEALRVNDLPVEPQAAVDWVNDVGVRDNAPCLSQVVVESVDNGIADIFSWGGGTTADGTTMRNWVAHPEFLILSRYARFSVKSVLKGRTYAALHRALPPNIVAFLNSPYAETSWTAGVVAEALWAAASSYRKRQVSFRAAWLKAGDRAASFMLAAGLRQAGYVVISYSKGAVTVAASEESAADLVHDALSLGLLPPLSLTMRHPHPETRPIPWGGDGRGKADATLRATGQRDLLWELDRIMLMRDDQRKGAVQEILQRRRRSTATAAAAGTG